MNFLPSLTANASTQDVVTLVNVGTDLCLDSLGNLNAYPTGCNGGNYQRWARDGETWRNIQSSLCLDSNSNGDAYTLACNGGDNQRWTDYDDQMIRNVATNLCLEANNQDVYTAVCDHTEVLFRWNREYS
jgi:hypothetical protein